MWSRPGRLIAISVGIIAGLISLVLQEYGVGWKYSEIFFGTILLVWCLLSIFRPEWHRQRFWPAMIAIVAVHLTGWTYLANRIERFGFVFMFLLIIVEIMLGAGVILKSIPEDYGVMVDHIHRW